jgi:hypothetical protein
MKAKKQQKAQRLNISFGIIRTHKLLFDIHIHIRISKIGLQCMKRRF